MKPFPDIIPATEDQWRNMYDQYHDSVERRQQRLGIVEMTLLIIGAVLLVTAIVLGPLQMDLSIILLSAGLVSMLIVVPLSEYSADSTRRLDKAADESDATKYWSLRREAASCRDIGKTRKARGIDPEDDYYYDNLARRHDAAADALLAAHRARTAS